MYRAVTWAVLDAGVDPHDTGAVAAVVEQDHADQRHRPAGAAHQRRRPPGRRRDPRSRGDRRGLGRRRRTRRPRRARRPAARDHPGGRPDRRRGPGHRLGGRAGRRPQGLPDRLRGGARPPPRHRAGRRRRCPPPTLAATQADLARRDALDSTRATDPLRRADDAIEVDTTGLDIDGVVAAVQPARSRVGSMTGDSRRREFGQPERRAMATRTTTSTATSTTATSTRTTSKSRGPATGTDGDGVAHRTSSCPCVAVVGRPNVGKSTLVNRIIGRRQAVVEDIPGVTRDRVAYDADWAGRRFTVRGHRRLGARRAGPGRRDRRAGRDGRRHRRRGAVRGRHRGRLDRRRRGRGAGCCAAARSR